MSCDPDEIESLQLISSRSDEKYKSLPGSLHRAMAEALQKLVLDSLAESGTIQDTRTLVTPDQRGPATSHEAQITILGALNSLLSREACRSLLTI